MNIKNKIKQYGIKNSFARAGKIVLRKVGVQYESYWYMEMLINEEELASKMAQYDYSDVQELDYNNFLKADPEVFTPKKLALIKKRFETGKYWAYGIIRNNTIAYSCWINADQLQYPTIFKKNIPFSQQEGLLQDSYCNPIYRGHGYHSKMNLYRLSIMAKKKLKKAIAIVLSENIPAFKTQKKSGFSTVKKITCLRLLGKGFFFDKKII